MPDVEYHPDRPYLEPGEIEVLELFAEQIAERGTVYAGRVVRTLDGQVNYEAFGNVLREFHLVVDWPEEPDGHEPLRIEGRMLPGLPRALWDEVCRWRYWRGSRPVDIVGTLIEIIPPDASPEVLPLIAAFAGVPTDCADERSPRVAGLPRERYPEYTEPLTGDWAQWVEVNRAMCAVVHADLM